MFALIKREIEDNIPIFAISVLVAAIFTGTIIYSVTTRQAHQVSPRGISNTMVVALIFHLPICLFSIAAAMGAAQMYLDKNKKISAFLSTLTTTRRRIFVAKIIAGVFGILLAIVPIALTNAVLLQIFHVAPVSHMYMSFFARLFLFLFLASFTCYAFGLQMGCSPNRFRPILGTLGAVILLAVPASVLIIKGLGVQSAVILLVLTFASLTRTWNTFMSTSL
jgi:hypothetical protein